MKRHILLLFAITVLMGCTSSKDKNINQIVDQGDAIMLLGEVNRDGLKMKAFDSWYSPGYENYQPKPEVIKELKPRSEEHTSELQSRPHLVCRLLLEKK